MSTLEERFWAKVDTSGECWLWTAATDGHGYGSFHVNPDAKPKRQPVPHLNRATARAAEYGTTVPTHDLGDDE